MVESSNDFGLVDEVGAEAIGPPGQRTFRLIARGGSEYASLWMEKEQLNALGAAIQQQIVRLGRPEAGQRPARLLEGREIPAIVGVEFHCGQIGLGYDERRQEFLVLAYPTEAGGNDPAGWSGRITLAQGRALSREIERLVNAGRPRCPLCGLLIEGPSHNCPRSNGHARELTGS